MTDTNIEKIRNIGIIAHIDAGKTTTTERILYYTGTEHKMGEVDEGNTVTDYLEDEKERGITITSAAIKCIWKEHSINIIDTPGHVDFTAEVERSLRVLDGAVGIFCAVAGVEAQSETVWKQASKYKIPRIAFINKMDRVGANFENVLTSMQNRLAANPLVLNIPLGTASEFKGVVDILKRKALFFKEESLGRVVVEKEIPDSFLDKAKYYYNKLIDTLADFDDEIIEKYSEGVLTLEDIHKSIRKGTIEQHIHPVLVGAALRNKGIQCLLDAIISYLPSPLDIPPVTGFHPKTNKQITQKPDSKNLCAFAFKTAFHRHGVLTYLRIYSGTLKEGMQVYNPGSNKTERINRILYIHANHLSRCEEAGPGEIVGVQGLRYTVTGDTLCRKNKPIILERISFPETVISKAIEPKTTADKDHLLEVLEIISKDDPTFCYSIEEETGQILISGMGELHLDIIHSRILKEHKIQTKLGKPQVSYRETIEKEAQAECRFQKQFGNREHYAYLVVKVEPCSDSLIIKNKLSSDQVPKVFYPAIEEGIQSAASSGDLAGYPLVNIKVTVLDGEAHPVHSSEMAFSKAAYEAVKKALHKGGYLLLEPIMRFQLQIPVKYLGDILQDLQARRAEIEEMEVQGEMEIITGKVPLIEMFGYSNTIRTITQGRGTYTMEPCQYAVVPKTLQDKLIS